MGDSPFNISDFLDPNEFIKSNTSSNYLVYDTMSRRNQDNYKNFRVLARRSIYLKNDDTTDETTVKNVTIPLKFKSGNHMKFDGTTQTVTGARTFLVIIMQCR